MKEFVSKPVHIQGKQFDGTRESAKEITDWAKSLIDDYQSSILKEEVSRFGFESNIPLSVNSEHTLMIFTDRAQYYINRTDWLVLIVDTGIFTTYTDERLNEIYTAR